MEFPKDLKYTEEHEWVLLEGDVAVVGITDYAQSELGDIVFVELPEPGARLDQGAVFGTIEAVKTVSDLYAPVGGEVVEVNDELVDSPDVVNKSPYEKGWMVRIRVDDPAELEGLMDAGRYRAHIGEGG